MSDTLPSYPQPQQDDVNAPLLAGWSEGRLVLQRCVACGRAIFYPRAMCPHCWSTDLGWFEASGRGRVASWSHVWKPDAAFAAEIPVVLVEVQLEEGVTMLSRIVGANRQSVQTGSSVALVPMPEARRYPLPTFRLA